MEWLWLRVGVKRDWDWEWKEYWASWQCKLLDQGVWTLEELVVLEIQSRLAPHPYIVTYVHTSGGFMLRTFVILPCMMRKWGLFTFSWTDLNRSVTREGVALLPLIKYLFLPPITICLTQGLGMRAFRVEWTLTPVSRARAKQFINLTDQNVIWSAIIV